jgi:hypothetical protein
MFLWWSPLKIVQRIKLHAELWLPWHSKEKKSSFKKPKELELRYLFGVKHLLVSVYQVCSNKSPGVKIGPTQGVIDFPYMFIGKTSKILELELIY